MRDCRLIRTSLYITDYYSRWRPGFGTVVTGLLIFSCFVNYFFLAMTYYVAKMRIRMYDVLV